MFRPWTAQELNERDRVRFIKSAHDLKGRLVHADSLGTVIEREAHRVTIQMDEPSTSLVLLSDALGAHTSTQTIACIAVIQRNNVTFEFLRTHPPQIPRQEPEPHTWNAPDGAADALAADGRYRERTSSS